MRVHSHREILGTRALGRDKTAAYNAAGWRGAGGLLPGLGCKSGP